MHVLSLVPIKEIDMVRQRSDKLLNSTAAHLVCTNQGSCYHCLASLLPMPFVIRIRDSVNKFCFCRNSTNRLLCGPVTFPSDINIKQWGSYQGHSILISQYGQSRTSSPRSSTLRRSVRFPILIGFFKQYKWPEVKRNSTWRLTLSMRNSSGSQKILELYRVSHFPGQRTLGTRLQKINSLRMRKAILIKKIHLQTNYSCYLRFRVKNFN